METVISQKISGVLLGFVLLIIPVALEAQGRNTHNPPPIDAPLIREGTYALRLVDALRIITTKDEIKAESRLGELGISPRNGWMANYPVTPDTLLELQRSLVKAADERRLMMGRDEALRHMANVNRDLGLQIIPAEEGDDGETALAYPGNIDIDAYYRDEEPPVVSYYAPPSDFLYLYAWIPAPFWWAGFWFPGYYILHDFDRTVIYHRKRIHISNHFRSPKDRRMHRMDPEERFHGKGHRGTPPPNRREGVPKPMPPVEKSSPPAIRQTPPRTIVPPPAPIKQVPAPAMNKTEPPARPDRHEEKIKPHGGKPLTGTAPVLSNPVAVKKEDLLGGQNRSDITTRMPTGSNDGRPHAVHQPVVQPPAPVKQATPPAITPPKGDAPAATTEQRKERTLAPPVSNQPQSATPPSRTDAKPDIVKDGSQREQPHKIVDSKAKGTDVPFDRRKP